MKIMVDGIVRDMTETEENAFIEAHDPANIIAEESDYQNALVQMGVNIHEEN